MAETLLIKLDEMTSTTVLGGNVDFDKYTFCVFDSQIRVLEPILGTLLYDKIITDYEADSLSGDYLTLYTDYVKPILKYESVATFIEISQYIVDNGGIFKHQPDNKEIVELREVEKLSQKYHGLADLHIIRLEKWLEDNVLTEYTSVQDEVKPNEVRTIAGWKF